MSWHKVVNTEINAFMMDWRWHMRCLSSIPFLSYLLLLPSRSCCHTHLVLLIWAWRGGTGRAEGVWMCQMGKGKGLSPRRGKRRGWGQERMLASNQRPERILDKPAGCLLWRRKRDSCGGTTGWWPSRHCPSFQMIKIQTIWPTK